VLEMAVYMKYRRKGMNTLIEKVEEEVRKMQIQASHHHLEKVSII
jgi:hypothetical protein